MHTRTHTLVSLWPLGDVTEVLSQKSGLCGPIRVNTLALEGTESFVSSIIAGASGYCNQRSLGLSIRMLSFCAYVFTIPEPSLHFLMVLTTG